MSVIHVPRFTHLMYLPVQKRETKTAGEIGHGLINKMLLPPAFGMHRSTAKFGAPNFAHALLKLTASIYT